MAEDISASLGWQLADAVRAMVKQKTGSTTGTAKYVGRDAAGNALVLLPGAEQPTPVQGPVSASAEVGSTVTYSLANGRLSITGNASDPAVGEVKATEIADAATRPIAIAQRAIGAMADAAKRVAEEASAVASATRQHFWTDDAGVHVTDDDGSAWQEEYAKAGHGSLDNPTDQKPWHNVLVNSLGILLRRGLRNLVSITHGAVAFYDGSGNEASNVMASFGATGAQIGKDNARHAVMDSDGLTVYNADGTIAPVNATVDGANILDASIVGGKIQGATLTGIPYAAITNADIEVARVADAEISSATITQAQVEDLSVDYAQANLANVSNAWIDSGVVRNGAITNAMINSVSANKLTAGTIDASEINVTNLNADNITVGTINGGRIGDGSLSLDKLSESVYTEAEVNNIVEGLNDRIDGAIETHTGTVIPTLNNAPASAWNTTALRDEHVGDVYYVVNSQSQQNGYCYRFTKSGSTYSWQLIKDSDVTAALSRLQTAEGKITTFDSDISTLKTTTGTLTTKTESLETRMSDAEADILDKVDVTTFNEVSDTVDQHSQTISQHTTAISNKADSSTVTAVTNRVSKNEQDISGINTTIGELQDTLETKADGSTVSTISSKLNTVSDTVDGHTQTLTSVQNTLSTKADSSTVSTLTTKVNNVSDTVDGHTQSLQSITQTQTTIQKNAVKSTVQLWFTKADTTAPAKPTAHVTTNNAATGNAWNLAVPTYNSAYPNYYYCYEYQYVDGSYGWSAVTRDIATGEMQATARQAQTSANNAQATANKNVKESQQLWFTKVNDSAPNKPTSKVTSTSTGANAWTTKVPTYNASSPYYFYCMQYIAADGTVTWSDVVYDQATTEAQSVARTASANLSTLQQDYATFKQTTQNFESTIGTTYATKTELKTTDDKIDNLEIGGRNLLPSSIFTDKGIAGSTKELGPVNLQVMYNAFGLNGGYIFGTFEENTQYTFRVGAIQSAVDETWVGNTGPIFIFRYTDGTYDSANARINFLYKDEAELVYKTLVSNSTKSVLNIYVTYGYGTCAWRFYDMKLEKGNRATDWTPAPEDIDADISAIESRVSTAETSITQNKNDIALRAKSSDVYTKTAVDGKITQEVSDRNAAITAKANEITSTVSETYTTKEEFENLEIGGRNLVTIEARGLATDAERTYTRGGRICSTNVIFENPSLISERAGDTSIPYTAENTAGAEITLSFECKLAEGGVSRALRVYGYQSTGLSVADGLPTVTPTNEWQKYVGTGKVFRWTTGDGSTVHGSNYSPEKEGGSGQRTNGEIFIYDMSGTNYFIVRNVKIEIGNKATDWTPAPEDIETRVSSAESAITQNAQNIELKVSKDGVISSINQSAESVKIQASKVEIDGTAVFNAAKSKLDAAYDVKGSAATVQTNLDNLEVGGRNLLLKTGTPRTSPALTPNTLNYTVTDFYELYVPYNQIVEAGDLITVSFDWSCTATGGNWHLECGTGSPYTWGTVVKSTGTRNVASNYVDVSSSNNSGHVEITFKATSSHASAADTLKWLRICTDGTDWTGKTFSISNAKAERGNKATDWTPAPEDMASQADLDSVNRSCQVGNSTNTQTHYWRKFASTRIATQNTDYSIQFRVQSAGGFNNVKSDGIFRAHVRTNSPVGTMNLNSTSLEWLSRATGIVLSDFVLAIKETSGTAVDVELWCRCPYGWGGYQFFVDFEATRTDITPNLWTLYDSWTADGESAPTSGYTLIESIDTNAAQATANAAAPKANAVKRTQRIWYRKSSSGAPSTPGTASSNWVTKADDGDNAWTKMHVAISSSAKYIYTCEQYEMANGTVGYTSVLLDNTVTVIDGGSIITGTVTANEVNFADATGNQLKLFDPSDPTSYQVISGSGNELYVGGESVASFAADLIELGRNSESAVIGFCNEKGYLRYDTSDGFKLSTEDGTGGSTPSAGVGVSADATDARASMGASATSSSSNVSRIECRSGPNGKYIRMDAPALMLADNGLTSTGTRVTMRKVIELFTEDIGWTNLQLSSGVVVYSSAAHTPKYCRRHGIVEVVGEVSPKAAVAAGGTLTIGTLPSGCRPTQRTTVLCQGSTLREWMLQANADGTIVASRYRLGTTTEEMSTNTWLPFHVTFVAAAES